MPCVQAIIGDLWAWACNIGRWSGKVMGDGKTLLPRENLGQRHQQGKCMTWKDLHASQHTRPVPEWRTVVFIIIIITTIKNNKVPQLVNKG